MVLSILRPSHAARSLGPDLQKRGLLNLGLLQLALALLLAAPVAAHAQGWGFFGGNGFLGGNGFFGGQRPPPQQRGGGGPDGYDAPHRRVHVRRPRPVNPNPPETKEADAPKKNAEQAAHVVVVIGDSLGQRLANGLDDALSDRPDIAVLHKARDSSGLVRTDFYDWPKVVADLVAARDKAKAAKPQDATAPVRDRIDVAVMMLGTNDRQDLNEGGKTYEALSDEWIAHYTSRALAIAETFQKKGIPLIWVGVPITKSDTFADDMAALNDIYRAVAAKTGATFIDTWEAFSDDKGNFSPVGPDINGQIVRLRSGDGIHFTKAGDRKLAHFVDIPIRRALDREESVPAAALRSPPADMKPEPVKPPVAKPDAGPVVVLTQAPVADNGQIKSPGSFKVVDRQAPALDTVLVKGEPQAAPQGRADNPAWPQR